jgi:hypothetical protein
MVKKTSEVMRSCWRPNCRLIDAMTGWKMAEVRRYDVPAQTGILRSVSVLCMCSCVCYVQASTDEPPSDLDISCNEGSVICSAITPTHSNIPAVR